MNIQGYTPVYDEHEDMAPKGGNVGGESAFSGSNLGNTIGMISNSALSWYATVKQRPVISGQPGSAMRNVFGADLGGGPTIYGQAASPVTVVVTIGIVAVALVLLMKR